MEKNKETLVSGILNREPQMSVAFIRYFGCIRKGSEKTRRTAIPLAYIAEPQNVMLG